MAAPKPHLSRLSEATPENESQDVKNWMEPSAGACSPGQSGTVPFSCGVDLVGSSPSHELRDHPGFFSKNQFCPLSWPPPGTGEGGERRGEKGRSPHEPLARGCAQGRRMVPRHGTRTPTLGTVAQLNIPSPAAQAALSAACEVLGVGSKRKLRQALSKFREEGERGCVLTALRSDPSPSLCLLNALQTYPNFLSYH